MSMKERSWQSESYWYGFNGKENDSDWEVQDYGFRIYKPELGKFLSVDPLTQSYPWYTPYQFAILVYEHLKTQYWRGNMSL
jgi:RHS repeat-associated protein